MALEIIWSRRALKDFHQVLHYLEHHWGENIARAFVHRTEDILHKISENPELFKETIKKLQLREAIITKHNLMIYKLESNQVILLSIFDTRQHPKKKLR